ncbi:MAG: secretin N-terminal domain-containing protein, partial [Planctomycetota bacterium]
MALGTLALACPAVGQDAGSSPEQVRVEEAQAEVPPAERNRVRDMAAANNGSDRLTMNFRDASLEAIVNHLSEHAGLIVVSEIDLSDKVTVLNRQPVTLDEAIGLLNTLLRERGYTAVRRGRLLEIVDIDDAKELALPVRYGADPDAIGMSDTMITQIVPLRFADAEALVENLEDLIDDDFAELSANASSNALIVTNTEANIRRIVEIARALDQSIAEVRDVRVFALQHADAEDVAQLIEEVFEAPRSVEDEVGRIIAQRFGRGGRGRGDDDNSGDTAAAAAVQAAADVRSNSVVVTAPAES